LRKTFAKLRREQRLTSKPTAEQSATRVNIFALKTR
jgi:hypothetical protein